MWMTSKCRKYTKLAQFADNIPPEQRGGISQTGSVGGKLPCGGPTRSLLKFCGFVEENWKTLSFRCQKFGNLGYYWRKFNKLGFTRIRLPWGQKQGGATGRGLHNCRIQFPAKLENVPNGRGRRGRRLIVPPGATPAMEHLSKSAWIDEVNLQKSFNKI